MKKKNFVRMMIFRYKIFKISFKFYMKEFMIMTGKLIKHQIYRKYY